jgi:hypothetical protein
MMTEELIKEMPPLTFEIEYADRAFAREASSEASDVRKVERRESGVEPVEPQTKKERILALFDDGTTDVAEIARRVGARPSYVAQVLQNEGLINGYFDLYTTTAREQNIYSRFFRNVLSFKSVEAARESVEKIGKLYNYFERLGDRAGQHQAMVLALTGKNRARWSGKREEAEIFHEWLMAH